MGKKIILTSEQVCELKAMVAEGKSTRDIAKVFGCGKSTVSTLAKSLDIQLDGARSISLKMTGRVGHRLGKKHSEQTRLLISETNTGRPGTRFGKHSPETIAKISAATKGKNVRYTPEQKAQVEKMRQSCKRFVRRTLLATGRRKTIPSEQYLGYSKHDLLAWLGPKPFSTAEIDHYVPVVEFFRRGIYNPAVVNALPNLRWISSSENKAKSASVPSDADSVIEKCLSISNPRGHNDGEILTAHFTPGAKTTYTQGL